MKLTGQLVPILSLCLTVAAQNDLPAMKRLSDLHSPAHQAARGFMHGANIANYLEVPPAEHWNVRHTVTDLKEIRAEGFDHIRLPVCWNQYTGPSPEFTISDDIFARADYMVTNATTLGLNVIVNLHNFDEFMTNPAGNTAKFLAIWRQVAAHYAQARPESLLNCSTSRTKLRPRLSSIRFTPRPSGKFARPIRIAPFSWGRANGIRPMNCRISGCRTMTTTSL